MKNIKKIMYFNGIIIFIIINFNIIIFIIYIIFISIFIIIIVIKFIRVY